METAPDFRSPLHRFVTCEATSPVHWGTSTVQPPEPVEDILSAFSATWLVTFKRRDPKSIHSASFRQASDDNRREAETSNNKMFKKDLMEAHGGHSASVGVTCLKGATFWDHSNVPGRWAYITPGPDRHKILTGFRQCGNHFYKAAGLCKQKATHKILETNETAKIQTELNLTNPWTPSHLHDDVGCLPSNIGGSGFHAA